MFDETNENLWRNAEGGSAAQRFSPRARLALIKKTVFRGRNKFLRCASVIAVVRFVATSHRHHRAVVKIVVPHSVQIIAAFAALPHHPRFLEIVLGDEDDRARAGRFPPYAPSGTDDVVAGSLAD